MRPTASARGRGSGAARAAPAGTAAVGRRAPGAGGGCFPREAGGPGRRWTDVPKTVLPVGAEPEGFKGEGWGEGALRAGEAGALAVSPGWT